jgi:hypothetical protein
VSARVRWAFALLATAPHAVAAQLAVDVGVGVRHTSLLVHDSIVAPIDVRAALSPSIGIVLEAPLGSRWSGDAALDVSRAALRREEPGTPDTDLGAAYIVTGGVSVSRALRAGVSGRIGIGAVRYVADSRALFARGEPAITAIGWAAVRFQPRLGAGRLTIEARYDVHRFTTPALENVGFRSARTVHGLTLLLRARVLGGVP